MSHRDELLKLLRECGWSLVRQTGHDIYRKGQFTLAIPRHRQMNHLTFKGLIKKIKNPQDISKFNR
jgi:predicted RNA binding protein YcfA (HicA-like mRNA interferase family)